tara:strand:- start:638 stop:1858 length:1221 start_codon:yes stop_codon:yes gene_type:complete
MTHYVNSVDMLSYFWDSQLVMDWQLINSQTGKSGNGLSFEINYNPTGNNLYSWIDFEYFDENFNINDVGYLYRNNLKKVQGGLGFYWPELDLSLPILESRVNLNFNKMNNLDDLVLNNSMGLSSSVTFNNLWFLGGGFNYLAEYNDDLILFNYHGTEDKEDKLGPPIMIPKGTATDFYLGNDPHEKYSFNSSISFWENDFEKGRSQSISFGVHSSEYMNFNFEYSPTISEEKFRWLEAYGSVPEYIFAASHNQSQKFIYEMNYNHNRKISIQLYAEYITSTNDYGQFYKYDPDKMEYALIDFSSYYISYDELIAENFVDDMVRPISPQYYVKYYTKDHILNLNLVLNYEFRPGSNVYMVYSVYRDVVGKEMDDFTEFLKYIPSDADLAEVNFTQSLYLKIDYWFDF